MQSRDHSHVMSPDHTPPSLTLRHYDSCEDDEDDDKGGSSGFAVAKRSFHPPTSTATPTRTKRTEGAGTSPYASGYNSSEEYDVPRRADPEVRRERGDFKYGVGLARLGGK